MSDIGLYRLMGKYADGTASEEEAARLLARVQADADARLALARLLYHERSLAKAFAAMDSTRGRAGQGPARRLRLVGRVVLAAAAAALFAVGALQFATRTGRLPGAQLVLALGDVQVSGQVYSTGPNSYARLEYADGSAVLLGESTRVAVPAAPADSGKTVRLFDGELYLNVARQKAPLALRCGDTDLAVLGTRLHVVNNNGAFREAVLFDGSTRVSNAVASVVLRTGQRVRSFTAPYDGTSPLLQVETVGAKAVVPDWLGVLGEDGAALLAELARNAESWATPTMEYDRYTVAYGHWSMRRESGDVILRKDGTERGLILFGKPRWTRGRIEGRLRFLSPDTTQGMEVFLGFFYRDLADEPPADDKPDLWHDGPFDHFGLYYEDGAPTFGGAWIRMRKNFEIGRSNDLTIREVHFVSECDPNLAFSALTGTTAGVSTPQNTRVQNRSKAGVLIRADGAAMEFAGLRIAGGRQASVSRKATPPGTILVEDDFEQGLQSHWIPLQGEWTVIENAGKDQSAGLSCLLPTLADGSPAPAFLGLNKDLSHGRFEVSWDWYGDSAMSGDQTLRIEFFSSFDLPVRAFYEEVEKVPPLTLRPGWQRTTCRVEDQILTVSVNGRQHMQYRIREPFKHIALVVHETRANTAFRLDNVIVRALP